MRLCLTFFPKGDTAPAADGDYIARALHEMEENGADESKARKKVIISNTVYLRETELWGVCSIDRVNFCRID